MTLYRAVSSDEYKDFTTDFKFRTATNTLEAKQFFKSERAVREFVKIAYTSSFKPPYKFILIIEVDIHWLAAVQFESQNLDGYDAITIQLSDLSSFNNCFTFTREEYV